MRIMQCRFLKLLAAYISSFSFTLAYSSYILGNDACYITNIDTFLERCPTADPATSQILTDFTIKKDGVEITAFPCVEPISSLPIAEYTDALILLQGLRTIYYMDKGRTDHLPWTSMSLYDWLKSKVGGFNISSTARLNSCCGVWSDGTKFITLITSDESNRDHDRSWLGIAGNIGLIMHEARHVDGFGHVGCCPIGSGACDQHYDTTNLSPYGIQYWLEKSWLDGTLHTGFTCLSATRINEIKNWLRGAANARLRRFCEDAPPELNDTNNPLPPCDTSCAPTSKIEKLTNGNQADGANDSDVPRIAIGDTVIWTYKVTNTGQSALSAGEIMVTDSQPGVTPLLDTGSDVGSDRILSVGETWTYEAAAPALNLEAPPSGVTIMPGCGDNRPTYENIGMVTVLGASDSDASHYCNSKPTNNPPTIGGTPATSVDQNVSYRFTPTASDPDQPGDILIFRISNKPAWANFNTATGALTGTPTNSDVGTTTGIVITVDDQQGQSNSTARLPAFNLTVNNVNDAPTIGGVPDTTVAEDTAYRFRPVSNDIDGDILLFRITNQPSWASFSITTGALTGTPTNADVGTTSGIVISVDDQQGQPNSIASLPTFDLTVTNVNDAPTIGGTPATIVAQGTAYSFTPRSGDIDGDVLLFSIINQPSWADFDTATGALTGTPTNADVGTTTGIVITVDDQQGQGNSTASLAAFNLTVNNVNDAPSFTSIPVISAVKDIAYFYQIMSSDPDADDTLTVSAATPLPSWLILTDSGAGDGSATLTGLPGNVDVGDHDVVLRVMDSGTGNLTDTQSFTITVHGTTSAVAAVLPTSRSVQVNSTASAFGTVINLGAADAIGCGITPVTPVPANFVYQTTDPATNALIGTPNTPADIPVGGLQSYVFAFTPTADIPSTDVQLAFDCTNTLPAPVTVGLNTLLLSASANPVSDIVALAATPSGDGIVSLPGNTGANAFAVATVNVGSQDMITASADTGVSTLPVTLSICESVPATGACLAAPAASVTTPINAGATPTFSIFVTGTGTVPFDPANNRVFVRFRDAGGVTRGSTSVAVRSQ